MLIAWKNHLQKICVMKTPFHCWIEELYHMVTFHHLHSFDSTFSVMNNYRLRLKNKKLTSYNFIDLLEKYSLFQIGLLFETMHRAQKKVLCTSFVLRIQFTFLVHPCVLIIWPTFYLLKSRLAILMPTYLKIWRK